MLIQQLQNVIDDRVLSFSEEVRLREGGFRNAGTRILSAKIGDDVVEVLLRAQALALQYSTIAAISHMFEMVASSGDMVSRLGRSVFIYLISLIEIF